MPPGKQKVVDGPLNELEALRREKGRLASAKYYASHPEMREKKRVKMAEKRAAVKAKRRISDRPRKPKESTALHLSLPDSTGPLEIIPPWSITSTDQSSATASTSRSERQPSSSSSSSSCDSAPAAPTVSQIPLCPIIETSAASGPSRRPRNNTESRLPPTLSIAPPRRQKVVSGPLDEREALRREKSRVASARYYAAHPEIREKKRVQMAEKRAAVKAKRRVSDRPRKPKESNHPAASLPDSTERAYSCSNLTGAANPKFSPADTRNLCC
ncbi:hypothetical protein C8R46DRAFT_646979 [Mycena filopes]|nr:hypothetical protein C8R46DRAFT_88192 [Mycena filopes]KAJ7179687.1 hypothetical protein C8R46DRAFT_646979 [Mycena filopes]